MNHNPVREASLKRAREIKEAKNERNRVKKRKRKTDPKSMMK
jgi:hypothetical protein